MESKYKSLPICDQPSHPVFRNKDTISGFIGKLFTVYWVFTIYFLLLYFSFAWLLIHTLGQSFLMGF